MLLLYSASVPRISITLGITIGLIASSVQSLGLTIQRKSHVLNSRLPEHRRRVEHRRPLWLLGFAIFFLSNILGSVVQIASLPVVILAPLGAVSLLWNAFFARFILGDDFSPWMVLGTLFIAGGAILIALFGIVPETTRSLEDLLELFSRPTFIIYFSLLGTGVLVCLFITHAVDYSLSRRLAAAQASPTPSFIDSPSSTHISLPANPSVLTTGVADTITDAVTTERTPLLDSKVTHSDSNLGGSFASDKDLNRTRILLALSYSSFSGLLSGMCLIFAKSGVELLLLTLRGNNQFWRWQAWILLAALIVFALAQLWYLHKALVMADPILVCPTAFCFYNFSSIVNGLVYFNQFSLVPPLHLCLVVLGMVILIGGVCIVSYPFNADETPDTSDDEAEDIIQHESTNPDIEQRDEGDGDIPHMTLHRRRPTTVDTYPRPSHMRASSSQFSPPAFQIGISPVSPGFSIHPRGRRLSGLVPTDPSCDTSVDRRKERRRRTVSEGDFAPRPASPETQHESNQLTEHAAIDHFSRWTLLKKYFSSTRR